MLSPQTMEYVPDINQTSTVLEHIQKNFERAYSILTYYAFTLLNTSFYLILMSQITILYARPKLNRRTFYVSQCDANDKFLGVFTYYYIYYPLVLRISDLFVNLYIFLVVYFHV